MSAGWLEEDQRADAGRSRLGRCREVGRVVEGTAEHEPDVLRRAAEEVIEVMTR